MKEQLVIDALRKALGKRKNIYGLIIHSDRGGQYASKLYWAILLSRKIDQSMSEADNPYDNAFMESCFSRLKAELIQGNQYQSIEDARTEIFEYIEAYYNRKRLHSGIQYHSPEAFEQLLQNNIPLSGTNNQRYIIPNKEISEGRLDPLSVKNKQISSSSPKEGEIFFN